MKTSRFLKQAPKHKPLCWRWQISETSVYFYETTRRCIEEGCHLHTSRLENI